MLYLSNVCKEVQKRLCILEIDFKETFPDVPMSELPCLEPVVSILLQAEEDYEERRPGLQLGDCVDVSIRDLKYTHDLMPWIDLDARCPS